MGLMAPPVKLTSIDPLDSEIIEDDDGCSQAENAGDEDETTVGDENEEANVEPEDVAGHAVNDANLETADDQEDLISMA